MKRRAQAAAAPPVAKRKKLTKDETEEEEVSVPIAPVLGDRPAKTRHAASTQASASPAPVASTSAPPEPRNATDNFARRSRDDPTSTPPTRPPQVSVSPNASNAPRHAPLAPPTSSNTHTTALEPTSSSASPARLPAPTAALTPSPPLSCSPICWARVNRMTWWPGKVCTHPHKSTIRNFADSSFIAPLRPPPLSHQAGSSA